MLESWIISSIICFIISEISFSACVNKMKREGYVKTKNVISLSEKLQGLIIFFIPFFNIAFTICIFCMEESLRKSIIESGNYIKE